MIKCLQLASFTWEMAFIKIMVVSSKDNGSHPPIPYYCSKVHETSFSWQLLGLALRTIMSALIRHSLGFRSPPVVAMTSNIVYVGETWVWSCNDKQSGVGMWEKLKCDLAMTSNIEYVGEKLECVTQGEIMVNPNSITILAISPTKIESVVIATNCNSWNKILFSNKLMHADQRKKVHCIVAKDVTFDQCYVVIW